MMMKKIGLIVNPIAGMGGSVGLKGTDGEIYKEALKLGAKPVTPRRTEEFLSFIKHKDKIMFFVAPGKMGEEYIKKYRILYRVIGTIGDLTSAEDTRRIAREMLNNDIELLVFAGGDGTARDIYDAINSRVPVIAIPAGVKVFSSVFSVSARAAAKVLDLFIEGVKTREEEVLDIDEEIFRRGRLAAKLYGYLTVPDAKDFLQAAKEASRVTKSSDEEKREIAEYITEDMDENILYLLGPGTTVKKIADKISVSKTLLGIDAVFNGKLVGVDLNEKGIINLLDKYKEGKIIVTPIGGNGFIFGRGSKQFSPEVLRRIGKENIIVVGTKDKINKLDYLRVDTGDLEVDELLCGYINVIVGYREEVVMKVKC